MAYKCVFRVSVQNGPYYDVELTGRGNVQEEHDMESLAVQKSRKAQ